MICPFSKVELRALVAILKDVHELALLAAVSFGTQGADGSSSFIAPGRSLDVRTMKVP